MKIQHSGIYRIKNLVNGKLYIGSAVNLDARLGAHRRMLRRGAHHSIKLQRSWDKNGEENFSFDILEYVENKKDLLASEQYWLNLTNSPSVGFNIAPSAGSLLGHKHSEETKERMSKASMGKKKTEEHRKNMSLARAGQVVSEKQKQEMSARMLGTKRNPHTEETKAKMSAARMGIKYSDETRAKMSVSQTGKKHSSETLMKMRLAHKARNEKKLELQTPLI